MADPDPPVDPRELARVVGERVRRLRGARGWSLSALAARAGIGKATLSEIESGRRNPTLETLYAIAAQLQIGLSELLTDAGLPSPSSAVVQGAAVEATLVAVYRDVDVTTEIYRLVIRAGTPQVSPDHGPGVVEHLLITAGRVRVGPLAQPVEIAAGEDWTWESSGPHGYEALGGVDAEGVLVMRHPVG